ncbi:hypothetical protein, partial [Geomonas limicola]|uniref:hypothetical protein n=1 Tax=Geomonas limicola TaxID=2740186 RepID=UPI001AD93B25
ALKAEFKILGKIFSEEKQKLPPSLTSGIVGVFVSLQGHRFNTLSKGVAPVGGGFSGDAGRRSAESSGYMSSSS